METEVKTTVEERLDKDLYKRAHMGDVIKYAFGGLGSNLAFYLMMSYLTFFYTDIFGIAPLTVANIMLITRLFDAVTDPFFGILADRTRTKFGRYRPWIIAGAPLIGILIFLLFSTPSLSPSAKVIYAYVIYIAYSTFSDFVNIPYHSLTPVLSEDPEQRTLIVIFKQGMGVVAQIIIMVFALPLVDLFGGGERGWSLLGALLGLMTTISFLICAWGAKNYDLPVEKNTVNDKKNEIKIKDQIFLITKNKPMLLLMTSFCATILATAISSTVNIYFFVYVLNRVDLVPLVASVTMVTTVISLFILPRVASMFGKKRTYLASAFLPLFPFAILWFYPNMPIPMLLVLLAIIGFFQQITGNLAWAMLPECVDYAEWKFGVRGNSIITSAITFINKMGMAFGGFLASLLLGLFGFVANQPQTEGVLNLITFMRFGVPVFTLLISIAAMRFFELDETRMREIRTEMSERNVNN